MASSDQLSKQELLTIVDLINKMETLNSNGITKLDVTFGNKTVGYIEKTSSGWTFCPKVSSSRDW